jgi:hypothetical protein
MKFQIKINNLKTMEEISEYWTSEDYIQLLEKLDYPDAENAPKDTLRELLMMALTDFEPNEAAAIVLDYKLSGSLNEGQVQQISHDMLLDKIAEEYPEIGLQSTLFHINQLLYKAFNGKFPNTKATLIDCSIKSLEKSEDSLFSKEQALKLLAGGLSDSNLIKRLFAQQLEGTNPFPEAEDILWELNTTDNHHFKILTSEYWISQEDFVSDEFEGEWEEGEISEKEDN